MSTKKEVLLAEMAARNHEETMIKTHEKIEQKAQCIYSQRRMQCVRAETDTLQGMQEAEKIREAQMQQEEKLAQEIELEKRKELRELKLRQQLRINCPELHELENKLRMAYVNKELHAQIAWKKAMEMEEQVRQKRANDILRAAWRTQEEKERQIAEDDYKKKENYKSELQSQIIYNEHQKKCAFEEFLHEKQMSDEIMARIYDEDLKEAQDKAERTERIRKEMYEFKAAQQIWKKIDQEKILEEKKQAEEFLKAKAKITAASELERKRRAEIKEKIADEICKKLYETELKRQEKEELLQALTEEEEKEMALQKEKADLERQHKMRMEMRQTFAWQIADQEKKRQFEEEQNVKYKQQLMEKIMHDEKLEQLSNEKRRLKMIQIRKDVEQVMFERQRQRAEEIQQRIRLQEIEKEEEEERNRLIEKERLAILREHAPYIQGYFPKGVLKPDDLAQIGLESTNSRENKN